MRRDRGAGLGRALREAPVQRGERIRLRRATAANSMLASSAKCRSSTMTAPQARRAARRRASRRPRGAAAAAAPRRRARPACRARAGRARALRVARSHRAPGVLGEQARAAAAPARRRRCRRRPAARAMATTPVATRRRTRAAAGVLPMPASPTSRNGASCRPGVVERCELALAADQARRPDQARRNDGAARRQRRAAALDRRQQLDRLGRRPRAELVLQALLEALEGGDRRGAVAAQVVQAHQPALGVLGERIALDQALRVDQAARDRAALLATRRRRRRARRRAARATCGARRAATRRAREGRRSRGRRAARRCRRARRRAIVRQRRWQVGGRVRAPRLSDAPPLTSAHSGVAAQAEQALAQARVGLLAVDAGQSIAATWSLWIGPASAARRAAPRPSPRARCACRRRRRRAPRAGTARPSAPTDPRSAAWREQAIAWARFCAAGRRERTSPPACRAAAVVADSALPGGYRRGRVRGRHVVCPSSARVPGARTSRSTE